MQEKLSGEPKLDMYQQECEHLLGKTDSPNFLLFPYVHELITSRKSKVALYHG